MGSGVILNLDSVHTEPDFTSPIWIPSDEIAGQLSVQIDNRFFATFAPGTAKWTMDVPFAQGLYQVFIMDTLYASGGTLDFQVQLDQTEIFPYIGIRGVDFQSSQANPPQLDDIWHSIGIYNLDHEGILSVSTQWEERDDRSIVAVDRVLIVHLPDSTYSLISQLPLGNQIFIVDDLTATLENVQTPISLTEKLSWRNEYQVAINPDEQFQVSWVTQDPVSVGIYQVWVWLPEVNGSAQTTYHLMINGDLIAPLAGTNPGPVQHGGRLGGQWVNVGTWEISAFYGNSVNLILRMNMVAGATSGDVAVDAVAFIKQP
jgi:hypothetical protein